MDFLKLKEGDKVIYLGNINYKLANGQEVKEEGEELFIKSDVTVQNKFFKKVEAQKVEIKEEPKEETKNITKKTNKK